MSRTAGLSSRSDRTCSSVRSGVHVILCPFAEMGMVVEMVDGGVREYFLSVDEVGGVWTGEFRGVMVEVCLTVPK